MTTYKARVWQSITGIRQTVPGTAPGKYWTPQPGRSPPSRNPSFARSTKQVITIKEQATVRERQAEREETNAAHFNTQEGFLKNT